MQLPVLGCTFLTLSEREERIRAGTDHQGTDNWCPDDQCPAVPPTSSVHLCLAVHPPVPSSAPPVPSSAPTCATQQCHTPVLRSATYLCPAVPPTCAHPPVPSSAASQCHQSVPSSCASQCLAVPSSDA
ncbi:unnamed protein product, partial [Staurois parvus]